ncbi:MAG: ribosome-associated translation inhibitor RaiA [Muribaculaceae bacterium]|nr:ribosome-associated translation inhibitor RaiA [Muribaculaceae bacterium]
MDVRIQSLHFEVSEKLTEFINKKAERLAHRYPSITTVEATLKVVKPETAMNKEVVLLAVTPQTTAAATKTADSFEEAVDLALEAIERQLEKHKDSK